MNKKKAIFVVGLLLLFGCSKKENINKDNVAKDNVQLTQKVAVRSLLKEEIGKNVICPVMKSKFDVKEFTEVVEYKGKSYYFCCAGCIGSFNENPEKYIE
jgi:YHS domain-containing protein